MNAGARQQIKIGFPFRCYLKQLFSADTYVRYVNPFNFWHKYKINHLETCGEINTIQHLESCYQLDYRVAKHRKITLKRDYGDISRDSLAEQAKLNTIYISQPRII